MSKADEIERADKIINGDTNKIYLGFEIDVPNTNYKSNFNTLVLDVYKIRELDKYGIVSRVEIETKNRILEEIQNIAELLKYKEIKDLTEI